MTLSRTSSSSRGLLQAAVLLRRPAKLDAMLFFLVAALVALVLLHHWHGTRTFWPRRGIVGVPSLPFLGSSTALLTRSEYRGNVMQRFYTAARAQGLSCVGLFVATQPTLLVTDLGAVRDVLVKDFGHFMDHGKPVDRQSDPLSATLFNLEGAEWQSLRQKLTPTFTSGRMRAMFPLVEAVALDLHAALDAALALRPGRPLDTLDLMSRFTTDVIGSCAFGIQANALRDPDCEFRVMGKAALDRSLLQVLFLILFAKARPFVSKYLFVRVVKKRVTDFFTRVFWETVEFRRANKVVRNDFVDLLMQVHEKDGVDRDLLPAQGFIFFLAGFETSSYTLSNCLFELAHHQDVQDRVRAEVDAVLDRHGGRLVHEALQELAYMERVLDETMRLYPPSNTATRAVSQDYVLPASWTTASTGTASTAGQRVLHKGTKVVVPLLAIHRDPEYYPEPTAFDPDRFTEQAKQARPQYAFLPFGKGPRHCIGVRFAMMQMKLGLAAVVRSFRVLPPEGSTRPHSPRLDAKSFLTRVEGGHMLRVERV